MPPKTEQTPSLRLTRMIPATAEQAFRAWTAPEQITRWWLPPGFENATAEVDLRVGGTFRIGMNPKGAAAFYAVGTFKEVKRPDRLVYTWRWEPAGTMDPRETLVTVEFRERGGTTEMTLVHQRFASEKERDSHAEGWAGCMERMSAMARLTPPTGPAPSAPSPPAASRRAEDVPGSAARRA